MAQVWLGLGVALCLAAVGRAMAEEGWVSLFDGRSLNGWKAGGPSESFRVADGQIACDGPRSHLYFVGEDGRADFRSFELSAEVRTEKGANSGIYFHTAYQESGWPDQGFEVQVLNARPRTGASPENKLTGSLYAVRNVYKPLVRDGDWYRMRVTVRGKRVQVRVNDVLVVDYVEPTPAPEVPGHPQRRLGHGTFALQCHDPSSKAFYRNLKVRPLPEEPGGAPAAPALTDYERELLRLGARNYPLVNFHVHLKGGLTLEQAMDLSRRSGIGFGIAVNCGLNFPVTDDAGIRRYLETMQGKPVFVGMQAEGREWVTMFSRDAIARFDYVFTDAMTIVDGAGTRRRLWIKEEIPEIPDKQAFMEMLVDRIVRILSDEPIDLYVNPTFLPAPIAADYDELWTPERMQRVIDAAKARGIAIEINAGLRLPSAAFLRLAKAAGCKFAFGTNNAGSDVGDLRYCLQMVKELDLQPEDLWTPDQRRAR